MLTTQLNSTKKTFCQWQNATWADYLNHRDQENLERVKLFFYNNSLFITDMGSEGINHAKVSDLFTSIFTLWFMLRSDTIAESLGRCQLEQSNQQAAAPDLVLYVGENSPKWTKGEPRRIDLNQWRVSDLVGEISDTTIAVDLDEKKRLYASLGIPEYWVIDVQGERVIAFILQDNGLYQQCTTSQVLAGLEITILQQTLSRLSEDTNISAARWFSQQIQ